MQIEECRQSVIRQKVINGDTSFLSMDTRTIHQAIQDNLSRKMTSSARWIIRLSFMVLILDFSRRPLGMILLFRPFRRNVQWLRNLDGLVPVVSYVLTNSHIRRLLPQSYFITFCLILILYS
ncbi:uncharacterized protein LOC111086556 [Limulus polyphemus]|uniref:Uncharacterized protein LOC111086556 n=1 Tax=Limulus polyphemus TaxID=6850 RepID=A0ABM1SPH4_LIMPO|nr:uncharacterized protein LOC111086556 [Limulus polyphemus]